MSCNGRTEENLNNILLNIKIHKETWSLTWLLIIQHLSQFILIYTVFCYHGNSTMKILGYLLYLSFKHYGSWRPMATQVYSSQSLHSSAEQHTTEGKGLEKVAYLALMAVAQSVNSSQTLQTLESSIRENHEILLNTAYTTLTSFVCLKGSYSFPQNLFTYIYLHSHILFSLSFIKKDYKLVSIIVSSLK